MKPAILLTAVVANLALAGCSFFLPVDKLKPRAAFDLKCSAQDLKFTEISGSCGKMLADDYSCTIGVQGCGQQATYVHVPRADWIMNVSTSAGAPVAPPAKP